MTIMPITKARGQIGKLADSVSGDKYVVFTKSGEAKAALVDYNYLTELEAKVSSMYQKTFISPQTEPYIREFSDEEIKEWQEEDKLD